MDGDLAPLAEIVALKEKYGAWLMIDEAHATGLYAKDRRGLAEAAGVEDKVEVTLGTLSKALGCAGGFVVGSQVLIDYLRNRARSLIYSTALPPAVCAAAVAAVDFVMSEEGHKRRDRLWRNVSEMKNGLSKLGIENQSRSAIIPVIIGEETAAVEISRKLYESGIFVPAIRFPTVAKGKARLRVTVTAGQVREDIARFVDALGSVAATFLSRPANRGKNAAPTKPGGAPNASVGATFLSRSPHSADLRRGRVSVPETCYFITTRTEGRRPILQNQAAARVVIESLKWLRDEQRIRLLGFVVMTDHLHVALALRSRQECRSHNPIRPVANLGQIMKSFKGFTSHEIKRVLGIEGRVWQDGYHDHLLRDRADFEKRLAYMHDNPVRRGLAKSAHEYPFSTAHPDYQGEIDWAWLEGVAAGSRQECRSHEEGECRSHEEGK